MSRYNQSEENKKLKALQIEKREIELERLKNSLVLRSVVQDQFIKNAAEIRAVFMTLPSRIRGELKLTLNQQGEIEKVIDQVMTEQLKMKDIQL
jgi:hypothetical protein